MDDDLNYTNLVNTRLSNMKWFPPLFSRLRMLPKVAGIAYRSLKTSAYARQGKYLKYSAEFDDVLALRDPRRGLTVTYEELYTIYSSVRAVKDVEGVIAEVGVYKGNTAKVICEIKGDRALFLFDTFEGMPNEKISDHDNWELNTHADNNLDSVKQYLSQYSNVTFVPGRFPESLNQPIGDMAKSQCYSLVNLDVDLYQSTLDALEFFYPKLSPGGRLISHNYNLKNSPGGNTPGVKKAFDQFFSGRTSQIIEIAETQCVIVKPN